MANLPTTNDVASVLPSSDQVANQVETQNGKICYNNNDDYRWYLIFLQVTRWWMPCLRQSKYCSWRKAQIAQNRLHTISQILTIANPLSGLPTFSLYFSKVIETLPRDQIIDQVLNKELLSLSVWGKSTGLFFNWPSLVHYQNEKKTYELTRGSLR